MKPVQITLRPSLVLVLLASIALVSATAQSPGLGGATVEPVPPAALTPEQADILDHMSIVHLDDGLGGRVETIRITGVNVQVVNGSGSTDVVDRTGNLIVGYQELGNEVESDARTGSHNLIVGRGHNYTSYGGLIAGESNSASAPFASVAGGRRNRASGSWTVVLGGGFNHAATGTVVGGEFNYSTGDGSVVVGGSGNRALPPGAGGTANKAVLVGGYNNTARAQGCVVVGGRFNDTTASYSAILGGTRNECFGDPQGGGSFCSIVGGENNFTSNVSAATVTGGKNRSALGPHDWVAGTLLEEE